MGSLRLYLALAVLSLHADQPFGVPMLDAGIAIRMFFILSGFYMALVLDTKYCGAGSTRAFYINRYLRLWPAYALSIALIIAVGVYSGAMSALWARFITLPAVWQALTVAANATIFGLDAFMHISVGSDGAVFAPAFVNPTHNGVGLILNFPAWTLSLELMFYLIAPMFCRRLSMSNRAVGDRPRILRGGAMACCAGVGRASVQHVFSV